MCFPTNALFSPHTPLYRQNLGLWVLSEGAAVTDARYNCLFFRFETKG